MVELDTVLSVAGFPARHGFSTVALGSMGLTGAADLGAVIQRRQQLAEHVGFDLDRTLMTVQEHGANIATYHRRQPEGGQCVFSTDALATDVPGQAIVTYHADCFPLLFVDTSRGVVAGAHAGWRGTLAGVATKTAQSLQAAYGSWPGQIDILIGPGICGRCYQVGDDVAQQFSTRYGRDDRYLASDRGGVRLDLEAVLRLQLEDAGVAPERIRSSGWCTREQDRWFSHRAGRVGRFLSVVVAP
ncbi:MAG TPA: polyphenol oxidase family protein [Candidatus Acidoferrum sp.]|nr:polyphenol oxidase family protein [Candidatus Acidoferrum sp.]